MSLKLEILNNNNYAAVIYKVTDIRKHENADRLQCVLINGNNVITDLSTKVGDVHVYFPIESAISKEFITSINGFEDKNLNVDNTQKGFFNKHGRVRALRLRGERSEGFTIPAYKLFQWLGLKEDPEKYLNTFFDSINGVSICKKYVVQTKQSGASNKENKAVKKTKFYRVVEDQFRLHYNTSQLKANLDKIKPDDFISITNKIHGTSAVFANVVCSKPRSWFRKLFRLPHKTDYDIVWSSRNVVKNGYTLKSKFSDKDLCKMWSNLDENTKLFFIKLINPDANNNTIDHLLHFSYTTKVHPALYDLFKQFAQYSMNKNHFYNIDIWGLHALKLKDKIEKGISLYGEIVGYTPNGACIQKNYDYGEEVGESKFYIYRITYTKPDGSTIEFTPSQIKSYCFKHNLDHVPVYFIGFASQYKNLGAEDFSKKFLEDLINFVENRKCDMCKNDVPAEGVVVTKYTDFRVAEAYKLKSFAFLEHETKLLDTGESNIEDEN